MSAIGAVLRRELALAWNGGAGPAAPVGFFLGATTLVPLAVGADVETLARVGPPLIWVAAALAALMTLERLFQADLEDGSLDQLLLSAAPLELIVAAKAAAAWLATGAPLALAGALAALSFGAGLADLAPVVAGLGLGMAAFLGAGLIGAALAAGVRRGGVLIALLVLPFFAPPIIFGAAAAREGGFGAPFLLLAGCALFALAIGPIAAAAALRRHAD